MADLQPIALCNLLYKILAKALANRLKLLLNNIISEYQSAFVPEMMITDNIIVAYETQHFLKRKRQGKEGYVALKVDMSKAYDRGEWNYLRAIMQHLGFCTRWINWIMECVSSVTYTILTKGLDFGQITPNRGLRQGDPLSSYLFIMIAEGLSSLIKAVVNRGDIHGVAIVKYSLKVSHLLIADDNYFFFKANAMEANCFKNILNSYAKASGQVINLDKSTMVFSENVGEGDRDNVSRILGVRKEGYAGSYLGLPSLVGRNKNELLGFVKKWITNRIHSWCYIFLSRASKEILLKNVIQAIRM